MDTLTGAEAVVRMLDLYGVRHIFGLCGDTSLPFYDALNRMAHGITHGITHVLARDARDERSAAYEEHGRYPAWRSAPDPAAVESAAAAILRARRPVFICGGGVIAAGAMDALAAAATLLHAPVCTTVTGKGSIADSHPLSVGVVGLNGGVPATREVVQQADLVVFVGCRAGSTTTERGTQPSRDVPIVHIDVDPTAVSANYRTSHALIGDARLALEAVHASVVRLLAGRSPGDGDGETVAARARHTKFDAFRRIADGLERPIRPERVIAELNRVLPRDAVVVADPGTPCPYVSAYYQLQEAGRYFITNRAHGALGYSMPAALGAWFARPDRKCVAIMGDGSFGFTVGELETVVRCKAPLLMLVLSNASFGWIKASQKASYGGRYFSVDFSRTDHAQIARGYGVKAWRAEDPETLGSVLREAAEHDGPALVDIVTQSLEEAAAPVLQWMG